MPHTLPSIPKSFASLSVPCYNPAQSRWIIWRDIVFILLVGSSLQVVFFVETHPGSAGSSTLTTYFTPGYLPSSDFIVDSGFVVTTPLYEYLRDNRDINDYLAALNSAALFITLYYVLKVTFWDADYTLAFRMVLTQLFRSFCGWFTFLPPSKEFLPSFYDYPEAIYCLLGTVDCTRDVREEKPLPFVTFFSGHVAMAVILANHMYVRRYYKAGILLHVINVLQMARLLATRGHYSIDIIIGWIVAVYVSNPAERLGRYYSKNMYFRDSEDSPITIRSAFENLAGLRDIRLGTDYDSTDNLNNFNFNNTSSVKLASNFVRNSFEEASSFMIDFKHEIEGMNRDDIKKALDVYIKQSKEKREKWGEEGRKLVDEGGRFFNLMGGISHDNLAGIELMREETGAVGGGSPGLKRRNARRSSVT